MSDLFDKMGREWNQRASEDARFYAAFEKRNQGDEFWQGGADVIDFVLDAYSKWSREPDRPALTQQGTPPDLAVRALEIGCGLGRLMRRLAPVVGEVHGLDVSSEMIARGKAAAAPPNLLFHLLTSSRFGDLEDGSFDFAYSFAVFQHVPYKNVVEEYFLETFRVLKPGGVFAAQFCMREHALYGDAETWAGGVYSRTEVRDLAKQAGFRLVSLDGQSEQYVWAILIKPAVGPSEPETEPSVELHNVWPAAHSAEVLTTWGPGSIAAAALSGIDRQMCDITNVDVECGGLGADVIYFGPTVYPGICQINFLVPETLRAEATHRVAISARKPPRWSVEAPFPLAPDPPENIELVWITDGDEITNYWNITSDVAKVQVKGTRDPAALRLQFPRQELLDPETISSVNHRLGWYEINFRLPRLEKGETEVVLWHTKLGAIQAATVTLC